MNNTSYWKLNGYKEVCRYLPVCHFPEDWTVEDVDEFEALWTGPLKSAIPFSSVVNSYNLKMLADSPKPKVLLLLRLIHFKFFKAVKFKCIYEFMHQCYACWNTFQSVWIFLFGKNQYVIMIKKTWGNLSFQFAWMNFEELLLMFLRLSLLSTSDLQQSCLNVLSGTQVLRNVSVCYMYYIFFKEKCRKLIIRYCFNCNFEKY